MTHPRPGNPVGRLVRQVGTDSAYVIFGFPIALAAFIIEFQGQGGIGRSPEFPTAQSACHSLLGDSGNGS
jgi:hypothetical protein